MKLRQHDELKETLKSDSNWEDYMKKLNLYRVKRVRIYRIFEY